ncbi:MAG TPA: molybdopterin-dependent oxidoreductase [Myxococcota bacterium]|nr:molybdopterin-dependent oxidoreductase [Myxococcota bacterium]
MSAAPPDGIHKRTCPLCEAMCGLLVHVEGGRVAKIRPNPDDVWSKGYICPKGTTLGDLHHDPDRVRTPLVRENGRFREASWAEAFERVADGLQGVLREHGREAVVPYIGNPTAHNFSLSRYVPAFVAMAGLPIIYSPGTVDQWPQNVVCALMFGNSWAFPTPDLDRNEYLLVMGANPHASQGSLLAAADVLGRFDAIRARGGKVVVVDPRRTGTCRHASEWVPIQPGTDAAWLLAIAQVLFAEGLVDLRGLEGRVNGVERVRELCREFTPEHVEACTSVPAETTRRIARELAGAGRAAVYGRIGLCNQEFGTLASWLVEVLNALTGNLDREGGKMWGNPIAWSLASLPNPEFADGFRFHRWKSRVRGAPEVLGQVPVSCLAEEIATPGPGQIRALIVIAGNPVLSSPGADRLDAALPGLDFMVSIDNWVNETSRHADVILPGLSSMEQPHYDELIWAWAVRNCGKYTPALFEPGERPAEWQILLTLAAICQGAAPAAIDTQALDQLFFAGLVAGLTQLPGSRIQGRRAEEIVAMTQGAGPLRLLDFAIRTGPWGDAYGAQPGGLTLAELAKHPDGIDRGALTPRLDEVLRTPSGRVELAPEYITADLPRLRERVGRSSEGLVLVSRRHVRSNNSWMHNVPSLVSGRDRCTLLVHPRDAAAAGLADGEPARVSSSAGSLVVPVEVSDEMMPGVVCLPHGWGHDKPGARLSVASRHAGVCNNVLAPGSFVDVPSGNAAVNGIPVRLTSLA